MDSSWRNGDDCPPAGGRDARTARPTRPWTPRRRGTIGPVASKGRGYRSVEVDGFEVLVGKGARDNDRLTFGVAEPRDFWLHVAGGTAGSHVVVRNPDGLAELPREVLRHAARLAAYHSKARTAGGKVEVHVCRAADVSKRPGAPAGEVVLRRWDAVRVYPQDPDGDGGD